MLGVTGHVARHAKVQQKPGIPWAGGHQPLVDGRGFVEALGLHRGSARG